MRLNLRLIGFLLMLCLTATAHTVTEEEDCYSIEHSWTFEDNQYSVSLNIIKDLYAYYQNDREHLLFKYKYHSEKMELPPNYFCFILSEYDGYVTEHLAQQFMEMDSTEIGRVKLAVSFVQSLPYATDSASKGVEEYIRYPVETLVDGCGDCEDKVVLLAAILHQIPTDFILLVLPEHMALGVRSDEDLADQHIPYQGKRYYYVETTSANWQIGQIPEDYLSAEMEVIPVNPTPSVIIKEMKFESQPATIFQKAVCVCDVELHNLGPGDVTGLQIQLRLVEKGKKVLAEESFSLDVLREGELRNEKLTFASHIRENCVFQLELTGAEIPPQHHESALDFSRTRRF